MKGLLYKDFRLLRKKCLMLLLFCGLYLVWGLFSEEMSFLINIFGLVLPMMVTTTIAYDNANRWPQFAATLPVSRKKIVLSKYYMLGILVLMSFVIVMCCQLLYRFRFPQLDFGGSMVSAIIIAILGILLNAVMMPLIYRFGAERARVVSVLLGVVIAAAIMVAMQAGDEPANIMPILENPLWLALALTGFFVLSVVVTGISYLFSCRFYGRYANV